ncbi:RNA polymerase sigma-70 factor, ECF subfamily [Nannocystis exedens]|uniref:RNA polymerase sigma-70 factor, ECF subfamily n=1 Tax=Nannocystis exedens TaxID=54 RepID=A0A1I1UDP1_9BACT|nr:RNA polymerase sigma factor [Nannocystis exedens]PCC71626.1 ECF RNA polymerase sigma-E factor [Nannocystis exedens]SFD68869.1 RNA polymerase sigma-70 factor, ECF subfamily [Nannocystis exedens]
MPALTPTVAELYRTYGASALRRARSILGDEARAHDVVQDTFVSLLAHPEQFAGRSAFSTWLYSAVTHRCLNILRDQGNRARLLDRHAEAAAPSGGHGGAPEELAAVRALLVRLPAELAQIAVHYYIDGMTHHEIAEVLGCSRRRIGTLLESLPGHAQEIR